MKSKEFISSYGIVFMDLDFVEFKTVSKSICVKKANSVDIIDVSNSDSKSIIP